MAPGTLSTPSSSAFSATYGRRPERERLDGGVDLLELALEVGVLLGLGLLLHQEVLVRLLPDGEVRLRLGAGLLALGELRCGVGGLLAEALDLRLELGLLGGVPLAGGGALLGGVLLLFLRRRLGGSLGELAELLREGDALVAEAVAVGGALALRAAGRAGLEDGGESGDGFAHLVGELLGGADAPAPGESLGLPRGQLDLEVGELLRELLADGVERFEEALDLGVVERALPLDAQLAELADELRDVLPFGSVFGELAQLVEPLGDGLGCELGLVGEDARQVGEHQLHEGDVEAGVGVLRPDRAGALRDLFPLPELGEHLSFRAEDVELVLAQVVLYRFGEVGVRLAPYVEHGAGELVVAEVVDGVGDAGGQRVQRRR